MNERDQALLAIRPLLPLDNSLSTEREKFQNETLRPILKFQNPAIKVVVNEWMKAHKQDLSSQTKERASATIEHVLKTNQQLRNQLFALVTGLMTEVELSYYFSQKGELNRRLTSMLIQRLVDQLLPISE